MAALNAERPRPRAVVATGDLTNNAEPGEIDELVRLLAPLDVPLLPLPGNHDDRDQFRAAFDMPWADDHLSWSVDVDGVAIVGLDTTVPGDHGGLLDPPREAWLAEALAATADRPTVVAMHHPPFATGIAWMDVGMLERADAFTELIRANRHVERILCGHLHRPVQATVGGVAASVGLSTIHHVNLDLSPDATVELIDDPAGYQLHRYDGCGWVTHTRYVDRDAEPVVPHWAAEHA